jgi:hypothetical protein
MRYGRKEMGSNGLESSGKGCAAAASNPSAAAVVNKTPSKKNRSPRWKMRIGLVVGNGFRSSSSARCSCLIGLHLSSGVHRLAKVRIVGVQARWGSSAILRWCEMCATRLSDTILVAAPWYFSRFPCCKSCKKNDERPGGERRWAVSDRHEAGEWARPSVNRQALRRSEPRRWKAEVLAAAFNEMAWG